MSNDENIAVDRRRQNMQWVNRLAPAGALALFLCGCATHYDITMGNGDVVRSRTKPKLNEQGEYVFQDLAGREGTVNRMRVRQIEPVRRGSQPTAPF